MQKTSAGLNIINKVRLMNLCAERIVRFTSRAVFYLGSATLLIIMVLVTFDVGGRYLFNRPLLGVLEICEFMLAGAVLLGLAYTQILRGHVMVELLYSRLLPKTKAILTVFHCVVGIFIKIAPENPVLWTGMKGASAESRKK